jgi:hypothetical protein
MGSSGKGRKRTTKSAFILKTINYMQDINNCMASHLRKLILMPV